MKLFKKQKSPIVRKAKEERVVYEAIYDFFDDDTINDDMVTIGRIYHDGDDFETFVSVDPYKFIFRVTYEATIDEVTIAPYKPCEV